MDIKGGVGEEEGFKIIHIPDNPPIPPHLQPIVNVYAAEIQPRHANTLVRQLNQIAPLENLRHVKRVRKKSLDGGKTQLFVILCMACEDGSQHDKMPNDVIELVNSFQLSTFVTKVAKYAAATKEAWEEQCKLWPTSYHPQTCNIDGITGFDHEDAESVVSFMKRAISWAKFSTHEMVNAAIIVDPSTKQVIASARDEVLFQVNPSDKSRTKASHSEHSDVVIHSSASEIEHPQVFTATYSSVEPNHLHDSAACLHPCKWAEQQLPDPSGSWHPLGHAAIVAIENAAARDRQLFPYNGHGVNNFIQDDHMLSCHEGSPLKKQKIDLSEVYDGESQDCQTNGSPSDSTRPYLCTGYDIYLVWEPCTMCAMALVHQRIRRIFYAFNNPYAGALGSVHRLQGEKSLNHHYAVFRVSLPEDAAPRDPVADRV